MSAGLHNHFDWMSEDPSAPNYLAYHPLSSSSIRTFALISAWLLFVVGAINVLLGLFVGPKLREDRAIFETEKVSLPLASNNSKASSSTSSFRSKSKEKVSYPAPMEIGFPVPAYGTKLAAESQGSFGHSTVSFGGAFETTPYIVHESTRPAEMAERRINMPTPPHAPLPSSVNRTRSGKGVVTIRTPAEEEEEEEQKVHAAATASDQHAGHHSPPDYRRDSSNMV